MVTGTWHRGADVEIQSYASALQKAAKVLLANTSLEPDRNTAWDATPLILLYRQAVELHLKTLVGEGGNFLQTPTDHITLYKTQSLRWLAQIVCRIIKAVKWEGGFKCQGVASLAEFSALVNQLEELDPVSCAIRSGHHGGPGDVPPSLKKTKVLELAPKLDALLNLLAATADGLAATRDLIDDGVANGIKTIRRLPSSARPPAEPD